VGSAVGSEAGLPVGSEEEEGLGTALALSEGLELGFRLGL